MADLGPLSERLGKVENGIEHSEGAGSEALAVHGESLGRVLEKVVRALEARLTEHVGHVDRRLAEMDAKTALDFHTIENHAASQESAFEKAFQQVESEMRGYVEAAHQHSTGQIASVDQKLSALQEALPAKFREIVEAVRQSMEARVALELKEMEERARTIAPEQLRGLEATMRSEVEALAAKLAADIERLTEQQQSQAAPLHDGLRQLEGKLDTLREELPPKIRQIVEAVESAMGARIAAGDKRMADQVAHLEAHVEEKIGGLRQELAADSRTPALAENVERLQAALAAIEARQQGSERQVAAEVTSLQHSLEEDLRRHAEKVNAVAEKLTLLQEDLPPKFKAIVDAVHESMDARMAAQLRDLEEQSRSRSAGDADGLRHALEAKLAGEIRAIEARAADLRAAHSSALDQKLAAFSEDLPPKIKAMIHAGIEGVEARTQNSTAEVEKVMQYASLLEGRVQSLEQQLHANFEATVEMAVERVWQSLEGRLQQRAAQAPPAESVTALREKSTSAEQSVMDLIAGLGYLFEKPAAARPATVEAPAAAQAPAAMEALEGQRAVPAQPEQRAENEGMPPYVEPPAVKEAPAIEAPAAAADIKPEDPKPSEEAPSEGTEEKPPVMLFKTKEPGRKWRIPFVSSFFLMGMVVVWLQFM